MVWTPARSANWVVRRQRPALVIGRVRRVAELPQAPERAQVGDDELQEHHVRASGEARLVMERHLDHLVAIRDDPQEDVLEDVEVATLYRDGLDHGLAVKPKTG